jgi:hypothetical protein
MNQHPQNQYPQKEKQSSLKLFLRDNWLYIVVPLVIVIGGLLLVLLTSEDGWQFNYRVF